MSNEVRLIDANALCKKSKPMYGRAESGCINHVAEGAVTLSEIHKAPTIDAVQVVHAYWIDDTYCSNCRAAKARPWAKYLEQSSNTFCHVCGAKMDALAKEPDKICPTNGAPCNDCIPGSPCAMTEVQTNEIF